MTRPVVHLEVRQFLRFVLVGVLNTAFGYGIYGAFLWSGVGLALSLLGATILGILFNFVTTGRLVFRDSAWHRLPRFLLVYGFMWLLGTILIGRLAQLGPHAWLAARLPLLDSMSRAWERLALEQFTAGVLFMPFSTLLTYLLLRTFVHGDRPRAT